LSLADALASKERDYGETTGPGSGEAEAKVVWFDDEATGAVIMELRTADRIGLLHRVAAALESSLENSLENSAVVVRWARIATLGSSVVDSFCLSALDAPGVSGAQRPCDRPAALSPETRECLERAVLDAAG
jgi:[protein-PII] uridylyltransferase